jgi:hypothetical protein
MTNCNCGAIISLKCIDQLCGNCCKNQDCTFNKHKNRNKLYNKNNNDINSDENKSIGNKSDYCGEIYEYREYLI